MVCRQQTRTKLKILQVTSSPLYEYVAEMRLNTRTTVGLGSDKGKLYQELYRKWNKEFRKLSKAEKLVYQEKAREVRERYKLRKDDWHRTYSGSNLAIELEGLKKLRAQTKSKLTTLLKRVE